MDSKSVSIILSDKSEVSLSQELLARHGSKLQADELLLTSITPVNFNLLVNWLTTGKFPTITAPLKLSEQTAKAQVLVDAWTLGIQGITLELLFGAAYSAPFLYTDHPVLLNALRASWTNHTNSHLPVDGMTCSIFLYYYADTGALLNLRTLEALYDWYTEQGLPIDQYAVRLHQLYSQRLGKPFAWTNKSAWKFTPFQDFRYHVREYLDRFKLSEDERPKMLPKRSGGNIGEERSDSMGSESDHQGVDYREVNLASLPPKLPLNTVTVAPVYLPGIPDNEVTVEMFEPHTNSSCVYLNRDGIMLLQRMK